MDPIHRREGSQYNPLERAPTRKRGNDSLKDSKSSKKTEEKTAAVVEETAFFKRARLSSEDEVEAGSFTAVPLPEEMHLEILSFAKSGPGKASDPEKLALRQVCRLWNFWYYRFNSKSQISLPRIADKFFLKEGFARFLGNLALMPRLKALDLRKVSLQQLEVLLTHPLAQPLLDKTSELQLDLSANELKDADLHLLSLEDLALKSYQITQDIGTLNQRLQAAGVSGDWASDSLKISALCTEFARVNIEFENRLILRDLQFPISFERLEVLHLTLGQNHLDFAGKLFAKAENLKMLSLSFPPQESFDLKPLMAQLPKGLISLRLIDVDLKEKECAAIAARVTGLKEFAIGGRDEDGYLSMLSIDGIQLLCRQNPQLEVLDIAHAEPLDFNLDVAAESGDEEELSEERAVVKETIFPSLKQLTLRGLALSDLVFLTQLKENCPQLEKLTLLGCIENSAVDPDGIELFAYRTGGAIDAIFSLLQREIVHAFEDITLEIDSDDLERFPIRP
ncbi:MAG: hypothetical protein K0S07_791 [Chlamydiales bacterium]|jgi:Leucine-rich repeat (LRR) protein|nr:hypothetical protein [Chlamydiales bacterium]